MTRINLLSFNYTTEAQQEWEVTFANSSDPPAGRLQSNNPWTFLPGWNVNVNSGLTISNVTLDLNRTILFCVAVGADKESFNKAVF